MTNQPYGMFCPISKACEILVPRWTIQILGELWSGSTRFNEIRRGVPGISPALLSKRLVEMHKNGLIERVEDAASGNVDYFRTAKAVELEVVFDGLARWAQRHIAADIALKDRDAAVLMWKLHRKILVEELPRRRNVIRFHFADTTSPNLTYWIITKPGEPVELCVSDPGFDVDLFIETEVPVMAGLYLGRCEFGREIEEGRLFLSGDARLAKTISRWLQLSPFADAQGIARFKP